MSKKKRWRARKKTRHEKKRSYITVDPFLKNLTIHITVHPCTCVSLLFRYGTNFSLVDRAEMTSPRADKDLLMLWASFNRSCVAPVLSALSDPARSTSDSLPVVVFFEVLLYT